MKKRIPKVFAVALSAAMLASLSATTVFAENTVYDADDGWTATSATAENTLDTITVLNVADKSPTLAVTAYQLAKGTYKDGKLTGYVLCDPTNEALAELTDLEHPDADDVTAIAAAIKAGTTTLNGIAMTRDDTTTTTFTAEVEAGLYIVIVQNAISTVYNPALVAVNVTDANLVADPFTEGGEVNMTNFFGEIGSEAFVKSSSSGITKSIVKDNNPVSGDFVKYGDTVNFKIDNMTIPSYSSEFVDDVTCEMSDNLSPTSFVGVNDLVVKLGGDVLAASVTENEVTTPHYTLNYKKGNTTTTNPAEATGFVITFDSDYIKSLAGNTDLQRAVEITYSSIIADTADINFAENKNTATFDYTNGPNNNISTTYHYTFGISANVDGQNPQAATINYPSPINKTSSGENITYTDEWVVSNPLQGAEFTLYTDEDMTEVADWAVTNTDTNGVAASDAKGQIEFKGLEPGIYYMKETKAPANYSLSDKEYKIEIAANLNDNGTLHDYTITTFEKKNGAYEATADSTIKFTSRATVNAGTGEVTNVITPDADNTNPIAIVNTTLAQLPNTGGIGTIIITVVAALGMGLFLTLFIVSRKKKSSSEK